MIFLCHSKSNDYKSKKNTLFLSFFKKTFLHEKKLLLDWILLEKTNVDQLSTFKPILWTSIKHILFSLQGKIYIPKRISIYYTISSAKNFFIFKYCLNIEFSLQLVCELLGQFFTIVIIRSMLFTCKQ